jgi:hypothetical protein
MSWIENKIKLILIALGIIITYSSMGIVVEKLFKKTIYMNGDKEEKFNFAVAFAMVQCITPTIIAKGIFMKINFF